MYGQHFKIRTDHAALKWLLQLKTPEGQLARWIDRLIAMDYFSKWPEAYTIPNQEAVTIAQVLVDNLICRLSTPGDTFGSRNKY